jgi:hypothetical protein
MFVMSNFSFALFFWHLVGAEPVFIFSFALFFGSEMVPSRVSNDRPSGLFASY